MAKMQPVKALWISPSKPLGEAMRWPCAQWRLRAPNDVDFEWEEIMRNSLLAGAALATIALYTAPAAALPKFAPGEYGRFSWSDYEILQLIDLSGQTLTIFDP